MSHPELLIEIGCEEIPAEWLESLTGQFRSALAEELARLRLAVSPVAGLSTPRRLVAVTRAAEKQEDRLETVSGPPARIARDDQGWTPAAFGFARKQGVLPEDMDRLLRIRKDSRGERVALERRVPGAFALELLPGALAAALRRLRFPKAMRWDATLDGTPFPFGRPIRWIVALFDGKVIPFRIEVAGQAPVVAGHRSRGHRFRSAAGAPGAEFEVSSFEELKDGLRERFVLLDPAERLQQLERAIERAEAERGARRVEAIPLSRLAGLVEWPGVVTGAYPDAFLALPGAIRRTVLVEHQKYLPLADVAAFLAVTGAPDDPEGRIRRGSERVTLARLRDAQFFWEEDRKTPLAARADKLDQVVFHRRLGSFREKSERLAALAGVLAASTPADPEATAQAARLAKCDLTTLLVGEFASLQGVVGGLLLREEGAPDAVWRAVRDHYLPGGLEGRLPETAVGAVVSLADNADVLAGLTLAGETASGAGDPFGLRRAAFSLIRILAEAPRAYGGTWPAPDRVLDAAFDLYPETEAEARASLASFFGERLRHALEREFPADAVRAVLGPAGARLPVDDLRRRVAALVRVRQTPDFQLLAAAANRVRRILPEAMRGGKPVPPPDSALLVEPAERDLAACLEAAGATVRRRCDAGDYAGGLRELATIGGPVDRFFDDVLVMAEDAAVRRNRLRLLAGLDALFAMVGDLGALETGSA